MCERYIVKFAMDVSFTVQYAVRERDVVRTSLVYD